MQSASETPKKGTAALLVAAAFVIFAVVSFGAFRTGLYRSVLDPTSSTGSFEAAIAHFRALPARPHGDVLVLGDSRIYSGFDPRAAGAAARSLRFLNGGVPGTTPRCWPFFLRAIDPRADRFRAVVIAVDTYADDDSAIGSIDGDDRPMDLRYVVLQTRFGDIPRLAGSFSDPRERIEYGIDLFWRGPELRDDFQALAAAPLARVQALTQAASSPAYDPLAAHPRSESLAGLHVDFAAGTIAYPAGVSADERAEIATQVLIVPKPSPSYALYRRQWLYPIAARYAAAGVPVFFVRIPTRPAHRKQQETPGGSLLDIARQTNARLIPAAAYIALERPALFADDDHLNADGSVIFSRLLGRDVVRMLADPRPSTAPSPALTAFAPLRMTTAVAPLRMTPKRGTHSPSWYAAAAGIGIPLRFQDYEFWLFITIVAGLFYGLPRRAGRYVLLLASYYFYARWNAWYVLFLWILTASDYLIAIALERALDRQRQPRLLLALGIAANLAFLGSFKYTNFATGTVAALLRMHSDPWFVSLFVPIGISFHTFQSISYLVDVYRGKMPAIRKPLDYALYLAFFPQLLAGPIVRAGLFFGELFAWRPPSAEDVSYGLARAGFGLVKKMAIADQFAVVANSYFGSVGGHPGAPAAWSAVFAFGMQIYFDFSGYSDIAIGCARLFGFVFPENFAMPYLATSVTDFWHRWHMTLSTWLRDYLYIPLGGSRNGRAATLRNLMLTMLLGGLWHGAQWTFVAWGGYHGIMLCLERLTGIGQERVAPRGAGAVARIALTFTVVSLGWVLFRAPSFAVALEVYRALFAGGAGAAMLTGWPAVLAAGILGFGAARLLCDKWGFAPGWPQLRPLAQVGTLAGLLLALELLTWPGISPTFIYFKF